MLRWIVRGIGGLLVLVVLGVGLVLALAHRGVRAERSPLPTVGEVVASAGGAGKAPLRLSWVRTASQPMPRGAVLARPSDEPYVMSHAAFVLEWDDGRALLVDAGMTPAQAEAFGRPIEWLSGGEPMQPNRSVRDELGAAAPRVRGIVFTHLHEDHVGGLTELCAVVPSPLQVFMTAAQDVRTNHTTRPGRALVAAQPCVQPVRIGGAPLIALPGFPGVFVVHAGGHTPGSQIVIAHVGAPGQRRTFVFTGDVVNALEGVAADVPKPWAYRTFVVPEDEERQGELRRWLRALGEQAGVRIVVSHDQRAIEALGLETFRID